MEPLPDFRSASFLRNHIVRTMAFYDDRARDPDGGFFHFFRDDGTVYDRATRHLVSSTRFVVTHAQAVRHFPDHPRAANWRQGALHGLRFLDEAHRQPDGGYAWLVRRDGGRTEVVDGTRHCYGLAFVLLAQAQASLAGVADLRDAIAATADQMQQRFWDPAQQLYADDADEHGCLSPYRGQNANMHACEAMLAAFDATQDPEYLDRAWVLAEGVTRRLAARSRGLIWEHWQVGADGHWQPDWEYNRHDRSNIFRPWGFQPGHLAEWAKLLVMLESRAGRRDGGDWLLHRARELFAQAVEHGWDRKHGGMVYGFGPSGTDPLHDKLVVCDDQKYHWVQAETIAAAALLAHRTHDGGYWDWYDRVWNHAWRHFVDHEHGAWYRILGADNSRISDEKSPAGKVDYHNLGACHEALALVERPPRACS
jgi:mannose/cellobiose epimerase-like protein (N-acyl-D-glucosamine 2-epimerase family)